MFIKFTNWYHRSAICAKQITLGNLYNARLKKTDIGDIYLHVNGNVIA